jgi:hypothetical protein
MCSYRQDDEDDGDEDDGDDGTCTIFCVKPPCMKIQCRDGMTPNIPMTAKEANLFPAQSDVKYCGCN